jgi:hypothetical protein
LKPIFVRSPGLPVLRSNASRESESTPSAQSTRAIGQTIAMSLAIVPLGRVVRPREAKPAAAAELKTAAISTWTEEKNKSQSHVPCQQHQRKMWCYHGSSAGATAVCAAWRVWLVLALLAGGRPGSVGSTSARDPAHTHTAGREFYDDDETSGR